MSSRKMRLFWKNGLAAISILLFGIAGCGSGEQEGQQIAEWSSENLGKGQIAEWDSENPGEQEMTEGVVSDVQKNAEEDGEDISKILLELYENCPDLHGEADADGQPTDLEMMQNIVNYFGERGFAAVDGENQVDMACSQQVLEFCEKAKAGEEAEQTIFVVSLQADLRNNSDGQNGYGLTKYVLQSSDGEINIHQEYFQYQNGAAELQYASDFPADRWDFTEEGYLMLSGSSFSEELYVLALSDIEEHIALRVLPLDEKCRELGRTYLRPVGFERNNIFIVDWSEEDFGELDFYDLYDIFYPEIYGQHIPYTADDNLGIGSVYQIPKDEFESVLLPYFDMESETLQAKTVYHPESGTYEYKPRGFYEAEYPEYPYSEVVDFTENSDGTITLTANVVYPYSGDSKVYAHEVVVRPMQDGGAQYVSNHIIPSEENRNETWHTSRLTEEEWEEIYGEKE